MKLLWFSLSGIELVNRNRMKSIYNLPIFRISYLELELFAKENITYSSIFKLFKSLPQFLPLQMEETYFFQEANTVSGFTSHIEGICKQQ